MSTTTRDKEMGLAALAQRRANQPVQINNGRLPAGAPMYFYCVACGHLADTKPENYTTPVAKLCEECEELHVAGWLTT